MPRIERAINFSSGQPVADLLVVTGPELADGRLIGEPAGLGETQVELPIALLKSYLEGERGKQVSAMNADMLWRRRGRFMVTEEIVRKDPRLMLEILRGVFVFRCEFNYVAGAFEYEACSEHFEFVPPKALVPPYQCVCTPAPVWRLDWRKVQAFDDTPKTEGQFNAEAWQTEDGAVFADAKAAAVHEFRVYATSMFDESAVALILADPVTLHARLAVLLGHFKDVTKDPPAPAGEVKELADRLLGYQRDGGQVVLDTDRPNGFERKVPRATDDRSRRVGQFTIPTHLAENVRKAILAQVSFDGLPPAIDGRDGKTTAYVGRSDHFAVNNGLPGSPPPFYDWEVRHDESLNLIIMWSLRP